VKRLAPIALLLACAASAQDRMNGPWEPQPAARRHAGAETRPEVVAAAGALRLFQRLVSPVDGPRCNLYPTCSEYGRQAVRSHGLLMGIVLTAGRMMRDNASAAGFYPEAIVHGRLVLYDPPPPPPRRVKSEK
jgi:putative membrane protein insertion efficiency factor